MIVQVSNFQHFQGLLYGKGAISHKTWNIQFNDVAVLLFSCHWCNSLARLIGWALGSPAGLTNQKTENIPDSVPFQTNNLNWVFLSTFRPLALYQSLNMPQTKAGGLWVMIIGAFWCWGVAVWRPGNCKLAPRLAILVSHSYPTVVAPPPDKHTHPPPPACSTDQTCNVQQNSGNQKSRLLLEITQLRSLQTFLLRFSRKKWSQWISECHFSSNSQTKGDVVPPFWNDWKWDNNLMI